MPKGQRLEKSTPLPPPAVVTNIRPRSEHHRENPFKILPTELLYPGLESNREEWRLFETAPRTRWLAQTLGRRNLLRAKKRGAPIFGKPVAGLRLSRFCTGFMATLDSVSWRGSPAPFWVRDDPFLAYYMNRKCSLQKTLFLYLILFVKVWFLLPYEDGPSHRERL